MALTLATLLINVGCTHRSDGVASVPVPKMGLEEADRAHAELFVSGRFPSAQECAGCHPNHYEEWSASPHAYAQLSPIFNAMNGTLLAKTNGTLGDFCIRCHTPVGMALEEPLFTSNLERHPTSREGITCIACHRINQSFGKVSGRRSLVPGDVHQKVYGPTGGEEVRRIIADPEIEVATAPHQKGRKVHRDAERFFELVKPGFCGTCHDVNLPNGFRLEEAFSEFKDSQAAADGVTCQDCHMGTEPGIPSARPVGPAARVAGVDTRERKLSNHMFVGPDYSIVHPGIFPHSPEAQEFATLEEWLQFDWKGGWGTMDYEEAEEAVGVEYPPRWKRVGDRYDARDVLDHQMERLEKVTEKRRELLRRGYLMGEVEVEQSRGQGIEFKIPVSNGTLGHSVPTGFIAERLVFVQVTVTDEQGRVLFRSGDLDPNGDLRDSHSLYVHNGELARDTQLFSLQSKFMTRNIRGSEREQVLAVNHSLDALPFVRPATEATMLTGRPGGARIHRRSIPVNGTHWAHYSVPAKNLTGSGKYRIEAKLIAGMVPVNLVDAVKNVGFDYNMSARQVAAAVVEGHLVLWEREAQLEIE